MDKIVIRGQRSLNGKVVISGSKNAVLPIMVAALLTEGETTIRSVPNLMDTRTMMRLLRILGAKVDFKNGVMKINGGTVKNLEAPYELVKTMRASFYVLGPLLGRFGAVKVSLPGGCAWGPRPVDYHLKGMEALGATIELEGGYILARGKSLKGAEIEFDHSSVGATGNLLMAAVLADGITTIKNAALEPEITQLAEMLNTMGADITGLGTTTLRIAGVAQLSPVDITVIPDRIEAGTFLIAGAALGKIKLQNVHVNHLECILELLKKSGANISVSENSITIEQAEYLRAVDVSTDVFPCFPTDLQAQWIALMCIARGTSRVTDTVYHDRFAHILELNRLGARITLKENMATVQGQPGLNGAHVMSTDIRASAALIIGGLLAAGKTEVSRVYHLDRGYERIEKKLSAIGAEITRQQE